jgi:ABC-type uncharacterized transport system substrate-binding protein
MRDRTRMRSPSFRSDNRKSKIQNRKWLGLSVIAFVLVVTGAVATAQQTGKIFRIGYLESGTASGSAVLLEAFRQDLSKLGWIEGKNITIEYRFAEQKLDRLTELAVDLVRLKIDLIVVVGTPAALAAKKATTTIPIVMASGGDPVGAGLVDSLAQPGGNVTGLSSLGELNTKRLEVLKDAVPKLGRVGLLRNAGGGIADSLQLKALRPAATAEAKIGRDRDSTRRQRFRERLSNRKAETGQCDNDDSHSRLFRRKKADRRACRQIPVAGYLPRQGVCQ